MRKSNVHHTSQASQVNGRVIHTNPRLVQVGFEYIPNPVRATCEVCHSTVTPCSILQGGDISRLGRRLTQVARPAFKSEEAVMENCRFGHGGMSFP